MLSQWGLPQLKQNYLHFKPENLASGPLVATVVIISRKSTNQKYSVDHQDKTASSGGGTVSSGGGTPDTGGGTPFQLNLTTADTSSVVYRRLALSTTASTGKHVFNTGI